MLKCKDADCFRSGLAAQMSDVSVNALLNTGSKFHCCGLHKYLLSEFINGHAIQHQEGMDKLLH